MKTPRELLLKHHRNAEPELDGARRAALAAVKKAEPESVPMSLHAFLRSLRWHLAGLSALWIFILFLHVNTGSAPAMIASIPPIKPASPQVIMASLRENRRQLYQLIDPLFSNAESRDHSLSKPRSDRRVEIVVV
jgi:hypothetical protein